MQDGNIIRVLGPIDLLTPAGPVRVGGGKARSLLGALVIAAGRSVSIDDLQRVLWGDAPPPSADSSLLTYVWRLRRLLGSDAVVLAERSYQLLVRRDQIDALRFEDLLVEATDARGDPQRCSSICRDALSMWRGPPFGELADDDPFRFEAMRLDELCLTTMELFFEAQVQLGHHEIVVAELENAAREHPYRERLWYLLIDALRRDGRRVEALRACRALRKALAELDIGPSDELTKLEAEVAHPT